MSYTRLTRIESDKEWVLDCEKCEHKQECSKNGSTDENYQYCLNRIGKRLAELEDKIEQGTLIELPCIIVGNGAIDAFGKVRVPYYQVLWLDEFGFMKVWESTDKAKAEKRLKEIQG